MNPNNHGRPKRLSTVAEEVDTTAASVLQHINEEQPDAANINVKTSSILVNKQQPTVVSTQQHMVYPSTATMYTMQTNRVLLHQPVMMTTTATVPQQHHHHHHQQQDRRPHHHHHHPLASVPSV